MKSSGLGQPGTKDGEDEKRQRGEGEKPTPAESGHDHDGECDLQACAYRPEQVGQDDTTSSLGLWQELGVECNRLRRTADAKAN